MTLTGNPIQLNFSTTKFPTAEESFSLDCMIFIILKYYYILLKIFSIYLLFLFSSVHVFLSLVFPIDVHVFSSTISCHGGDREREENSRSIQNYGNEGINLLLLYYYF